eukprot:3707692-Rhodomonas_salina.2
MLHRRVTSGHVLCGAGLPQAILLVHRKTTTKFRIPFCRLRLVQSELRSTGKQAAVTLCPTNAVLNSRPAESVRVAGTSTTTPLKQQSPSS